MFFVPEGTQMCGRYECKECGYGFLSLQIGPWLACPNCNKVVDMEIGPDEPMPDSAETGVLLEVVRGEENVEMMDTLLGCTYDESDDSWL